ncbi:MAG: 3'-5' exonuclease [Candidatus Thiodiazotropha sp. (ex Troendleina suluensis)]|nr:3'-5' exonuclease [Candidatus Thiodiazotropha sp. (ex Troendleina suluensis)]
MNLGLFYDTETSGMVNWKEPSGGENQPHIVQLAALLADTDEKKVIQSMDVIVKPDGWNISDENTEIHGITEELAMDVGIPERQALDMFLSLWDGRNRVAHNKTFDQRIIRIAIKRFSDKETEDEWGDKDSHQCTMLMAKPIMKMEPKNRFGFKPPKLEEAYRHFIGEELENAHTAIADATACMKIYFTMMEQQ